MAIKFEEKVLKELTKLQLDVGGLKEDVQQIGVRQEAMEDKIDHLVEIGEAQKELWQKTATKEDLYDVERTSKLTQLPIKAHSVSIADHERRLKKLEAKPKEPDLV